ncbi:NAD(P)-dependent oxidoreductase [Sinomonas sp. ASV486]|uniref:NAD(P)-dependent oxidoreductase n=1 Tax=Sinomonas sp. ASV486 TaxID=3051170 RepID=UPI0027DDC287|nr:NAD(P)-dependent oxidoreductase [Sinomonas sp. ASV486]MDQ4489792.1 NAD(P)-dependent oxidoreductase [Sinomonas sp. ASV486]
MTKASSGTPVGFIGLGIMGKPMARNLMATGMKAVITHRGPDRVADLTAEGALWAATPADMARQCRTIVVMLADTRQILGALTGPDGIVHGISAPTTLVVCSSVSARDVRSIADAAAAETAGLLRTVDAPVSGGEEGAREGTLSIMAGGTHDDYERVARVLKAFGHPRLLGPLGAGAVAKACNQMIVAAEVMAIGEAAAIAHRSGLDVAELLDVLSGGYAASRILQTRARRFAEEDYSPSGMARFMVKDLASAEDAATLVSIEAGQLHYLRSAFTELVRAGHGDEDISVTRAFVEERSRHALRS